MSQQWLSVLGVAINFVGFALIALEWHRTFKHTFEIRQLQLQDAYDRNLARERGEEPDYRLQAEEESMAREFSKLQVREARFKERLFYFGVVLVAIGSLLQMAGSWPTK